MIHFKGEVGKVIFPTPLGVDLTGYTVTVYIRKPDGTTILTKTGTIVDATTGQISWTTATGDLSLVGEYMVQVKINISTTTIKYFPLETFKVEDVLV